jgi:hypothetical protein
VGIGEVRVEFENKIYSGNFHIEAENGNKGRMDDSQRSYWTRISLPALMRLADRQGEETASSGPRSR